MGFHLMPQLESFSDDNIKYSKIILIYKYIHTIIFYMLDHFYPNSLFIPQVLFQGRKERCHKEKPPKELTTIHNLIYQNQ